MRPAPIIARWNELRLGFLLLTRIPVGQVRGQVPSMAASAWSWPLVGLAVGGISALMYWLALGSGLPPVLAAVLAVLTGVMTTGALHEDGLADLADGFGGGRDRVRVLKIMRDSRIGSYGALALGFSLLIRVLALTSLDPCTGVWALIGLAAASRAGMPLALALMPSARSDGLGHAASGVSRCAWLVAMALGFTALLPMGLSAALIAAAGMAAASAAVGLWAKVRIGGQTGDVLGAMSQIGELTGWLTLSALLSV